MRAFHVRRHGGDVLEIIVANTYRHVMNAIFCKTHYDVIPDASALKRATAESCDVTTKPFIYILG